MPTSATTLAQWREASRLAFEAERNYFEVAMAYSRGNGPKPSDEMSAETKRLRDHAKELFAAATRELNGEDEHGNRKRAVDLTNPAHTNTRENLIVR